MLNNPNFGFFYDLSPHVAAHALGTLKLLRPHKMMDVAKVRLGRFNDGGYVMADLFDGTEAAYSLGISTDVSWDMDVAAMGIPIYQYDHTIEALPATHPLFNWEKIGISGISENNPGFSTLPELVDKNSHSDAKNLLLKCDIEAAEWLLLETTPNATLRQFRQIVIELHQMEFLAQAGHSDNVRRALLNLTHSHKVVHVHGNNFAPWVTVGGVPVPCVLELTLLRNDACIFTTSDEVFPTSMDMPCNASVADMYLGRFEY